MGVLKRTFREFKADNLTDWAAALTYYGVLAIFPALIALVSILGFVGPSATQPLLDNLGKVAPGPAHTIFQNAITNIQSHQSAAGIAAIIAIALALWSASGYVAAFMRASNSIYDVPEGRPIWKTAPVRVAVTLAVIVLLIVAAVIVVFTGGLAQQVGNLIGLGSSFLDVWSIAKWPVLLVVVSLIFSILYWASPNAKTGGFRWVTAGGIVGIVLVIVASAAFAFYIANFGSSGYAKTYGAMASVVIFLVWLWIANVATLLGAEFNAELERGRRLEAGDVRSETNEPFVEPRDTRKMSDDDKARLERQ
jgi:membrane protein